LFFIFSFVPFLPLVSCLGSGNIHWLIEDSQSLEVCVSHIKWTCWFSFDHVCVSFFSRLLVCNINLALSNIFSISFHLCSLFLFYAIWVDIIVG
jgi:hypothetical protein